MHVSPMILAAIERVEQRAGDVKRAFISGATPLFDDVGRERGSLPTLDPLSVAPPDGTYFIERDEDGSFCYTCDGSFRLQNGVLCTEDGRPVLGRLPNGRLGELKIDSIDAVLGRAHSERIDADGTFEYAKAVVNPLNGQRENHRVVVGRVALARFAAGTRLENRGSVASAPAGIEPHVGVPGDGNFQRVQTMRRERSTIAIDESLIRLKNAYIDFDALQAAYQAQNGSVKAAMDLVK